MSLAELSIAPELKELVNIADWWDVNYMEELKMWKGCAIRTAYALDAANQRIKELENEVTSLKTR